MRHLLISSLSILALSAGSFASAQSLSEEIDGMVMYNPDLYKQQKETNADAIRSKMNADARGTESLLRSSFLNRWDTLNNQDYSDLSPEAQDLFDKANVEADRVNYEAARGYLAEAAALSPDNINIQFFLLKVSRRAAETSYGDKALMNYEMASEALRRLTSNSQLSPEQRLRVGRESERVREGLDNLRERDDRRLEDGYKFVQKIHRERVDAFKSYKERSGDDLIFDLPSIDLVLNPPEPTLDEGPEVTSEEIWTSRNAPGIVLPEPPPINPQGFGGFGNGFGGGFGEFGGGGFGAAGFPGAGEQGGQFGGGEFGGGEFGGGGFDNSGAGFGAPGGGFDNSGAGFGAPGGGFDNSGAGFGAAGGGFGNTGGNFYNSGGGFGNAGPGALGAGGAK